MSANLHSIPELDSKGYRDFGITTGAIVAVLFGLFFPWVFERSFPWWPWALFAVLSVWGLVAPMSLRPVYNIWMKFGLFMGTFIMTPIIMFVVFYFLFFPAGLLMKLFGKDSMARKLDSAIDSYRVESERPPVKNLEKPF